MIHSHAEDILPFSISKTPMCCVAHVASDMGTMCRSGISPTNSATRPICW